MAMPLTQEGQLVLRHLVPGETSEEIAAALNWPIQAVWNCTHTLIRSVLDELEAGERTPSEYLPAPPPVGSQGQSLLWDRRSRRGWRVVRKALILAAWMLGIALVVAVVVSVISALMQGPRNPF
jgi:hypothetical protein